MKKIIILIMIILFINLLGFNYNFKNYNNNIQTADDWWTFQGNIERTGSSYQSFKPPLKEIWRIEATGLFTTPLVVDNRLYLGCGDRHLYVYDFITRKNLWTRETDGAVIACPTVYKDTVFYADINGKLYLLNSYTGEYNYHWYHFDKSVNFVKPTLILNDCLYMIDEVGFLVVDRFYTDKKLVCYLGSGAASAPSSDGNYIYFVLKDGILYCISQPDQNFDCPKLIWKKEFQSTIISTPVIYKNYLYLITKDGTIMKIDKTNGRIINTKYNLVSNCETSLAIFEDKIVFAGSDGTVYCLDTDLNKIWSKNLYSSIKATPSLTQDYCFVATTTGKLYMLNLKDGKELWYTNLDNGVSREMSFYKNNLLIVDDRGKFYVFTSQEAPKLWVSLDSFDFGELEKAESKERNFTIKNVGEGVLEGEIVSDSNWLIVDKKNFKGNEVDVNVKVDTSNLEYGKSYEGKISVYSNGGTKDIKVSLKIKEFSPKIYVFPTTLDFGEIRKSEKKILTFTIKNIGGGELLATLNCSCDWLKLSKTNFRGNSETIFVEADTSNLIENNNYNCQINIESSGGNERVDVKLKVVSGFPKLKLSKDTINLGTIIEGELREVEIIIENEGGGMLEGSILINRSWITVNYKSFKTNYLALKIYVETSNLKSNENYEGEVKIVSNGGTVSIPVYFYLKEKVVEKKEKTIIILQIGNLIIYVNNIPKQIDVPPLIIEGRTYLPIRWVAEPLGANVYWDDRDRKVTIVLKDISIELWIGKNMAKVNGSYKFIDPDNPKVVPIIKEGRTMLPIRFVAENLGCDVKWDGATKTVTITYPKE